MSVLSDLIERRKALKAELEASATPKGDDGEIRSMTDDESAAWNAKAAEVKGYDARISELQEAEAREAAAAAHRVELGVVEPEVRVKVTDEPNPIYRKDDAGRQGPSFFRDMAAFQLNATFEGATPIAARERLAKAQETRAGDMTTVAGAGGQFAPPLWLVEDYVALARPARVAADLAVHMDLPSGVSSVNLPKVTGGTTTAIQATQNTALSDTAMTTGSVSSNISTIGGKQIVSMQLLQQGGIPIDRVVLGDLALDYAKQLDLQFLTGSGSSGQLRGLANGASVGSTTFTSASPAVTSATAANSFYNKVISAINSVQTTRFLSPDAIIMHPQRWNWILEGLDSTTRPLVVPNGTAFNPVGTDNGPTAQGATGTLLGLNVYVDPNVPTTNNTNQDIVYVLRSQDVYLWESPLQSSSFDATYADQASILFRVLAYSALIPDRYGAAVNLITGTGLLTPTL